MCAPCRYRPPYASVLGWLSSGRCPGSLPAWPRCSRAGPPPATRRRRAPCRRPRTFRAAALRMFFSAAELRRGSAGRRASGREPALADLRPRDRRRSRRREHHKDAFSNFSRNRSSRTRFVPLLDTGINEPFMKRWSRTRFGRGSARVEPRSLQDSPRTGLIRRARASSGAAPRSARRTWTARTSSSPGGQLHGVIVCFIVCY